MSSSHAIRCACGKFQAEVERPDHGVRGVCYCRDCRAFAHFLGPPPGMLDAAGGTDVVAVPPRSVKFTAGPEHLACMSLTRRGMLRWYTSCCRTPIGNTPRDPGQSHLGLVHSCLRAGGDLDRSFGPVKMLVNVKSAKQPVEGTPAWKLAPIIARYAASLVWARANGDYKTNPFFKPDLSGPLVEPRVLDREERAELMKAV